MHKVTMVINRLQIYFAIKNIGLNSTGKLQKLDVYIRTKNLISIAQANLQKSFILNSWIATNIEW